MVRFDRMLLGSFSGLTPLALGLPVTSTGATREVSGFVGEPLSTTSAGFCWSVGVVVQAAKRADIVTAKAAIGIARTACLLYSMNGPHAGSRTSPAVMLNRCLMRPSEKTAESTPFPPITVARRIIRPLGAK